MKIKKPLRLFERKKEKNEDDKTSENIDAND